MPFMNYAKLFFHFFYRVVDTENRNRQEVFLPHMEELGRVSFNFVYLNTKQELLFLCTFDVHLWLLDKVAQGFVNLARESLCKLYHTGLFIGNDVCKFWHHIQCSTYAWIHFLILLCWEMTTKVTLKCLSIFISS